jgi:methionyl-tRNA formyltransferase
VRAIFLGKNKPAAAAALEYLLARGTNVLAVVAPSGGNPGPTGAALSDIAFSNGIPVCTDDDLYRSVMSECPPLPPLVPLKEVDLVISFLFWKRINRPLIDLPRIGCVNFHPAPLPDFRGVGGYSCAIYENLPSWGVSAHFVDESIDTGDLIKVKRFDICAEAETAFSLEQKTQKFLLALFQEVIDMAFRDGQLPSIPQGSGRYVSRQDFEMLRRIKPTDTLQDVERKIRAFWYPPHEGAAFEVGGKEFSLVSDKLLAEIGRLYHALKYASAGLR